VEKTTKKKKKNTIHRKDSTSKMTTFTTFKPVRSEEPPIEIMFNPTVASDEKMLDLYNEVTKEVTNIWKRAMRDGAQLIARRNKEKQILQECALLAKEKLGLEQARQKE
jgi:hypothetical protein